LYRTIYSPKILPLPSKSPDPSGQSLKRSTPPLLCECTRCISYQLFKISESIIQINPINQF